MLSESGVIPCMSSHSLSDEDNASSTHQHASNTFVQATMFSQKLLSCYQQVDLLYQPSPD